MRKLCILSDYFYPGYKAGGPIRSCLNLALALSDQASVYVVTSACDLGETQPYAAIQTDTWTQPFPGVSVYYISPARLNPSNLLRLLRELKPEALYLNGMFPPLFTLVPLLFKAFGLLQSRTVLAPRGMLKPTALAFKAPKKRAALAVLKLMGIPRQLLFHATNTEEADEVKAVFGPGTPVTVIPNLADYAVLKNRLRHTKLPGRLELGFVGRVHPIKNLHLALQALGTLKAESIRLHVIGPLENVDYYTQCRAITDKLPSTCEVVFYGEKPPEQAHALLQQTDFFVLPSQGENFGHAIFEALALGKPVIISDRTPWRNLEKLKAGWDLNLEQPDSLRQALQKAADMDDAGYQLWSDGAYALADSYIRTSDGAEAYLNAFFSDNNRQLRPS